MKTTKIAIFLAIFLISTPYFGYAQEVMAESQMISPLVVTPNTQAIDISTSSIELLANYIASSTKSYASTTMSVGEVVQSQLLTVLIILSFFGILHQNIIGVKLKKRYYDYF